MAILLLFAQVLPYRPRPDAQIDGTVSRNLSEIAKLISLYQQNNSLKETVVVALGTNTTDNYQELLDQLVKDFPKGRRLIFVTPYDGNFTPSESISYQTGQYEKELAENMITFPLQTGIKLQRIIHQFGTIPTLFISILKMEAKSSPKR